MNFLDLESTGDRLLGRTLRYQAEQIPEHLFVIFGEYKYSYGKANSIVNSYAAGFVRLGVKKGDIVGIYMNSCPEYIFVTLALNKIGAIWTPVNTDYKKDWLLMTVQDSCTNILITDESALPRVMELGDRLPVDKLILNSKDTQLNIDIEAAYLSEFEKLPDDEPSDAELNYSDTTAVLWTSGTTGRPKGVKQSHNCWIRGAQSSGEIVSLKQGDILYCCLPLYNSAPWVSMIYTVLVHGITLALDTSFSVNHFWERCKQYNATVTFTLGSMHMFLWNCSPKPDDADNLIREAIMIPMPEELIQPFMQRFGLEAIHQGYGQSEVMTLLRRSERPGRKWKPNCAGEVAKGIELKLLDDNDNEVPPGEPGEFCVRPIEPYVIFNGYFNDCEATLEAFRNLWYHTGDLGIRDQDGDYFFYDRKSDYIRYKGRNLSSFQIEGIVRKHPDVAQVAAHGVVSKILASEAELKIAVVRKPNSTLTEEELAKFINENAPYFYVPRYIEFLDDLPRTPTDKVQKYNLRERGVTETTWDREAVGFKVVR